MADKKKGKKNKLRDKIRSKKQRSTVRALPGGRSDWAPDS